MALTKGYLVFHADLRVYIVLFDGRPKNQLC